MKTLRDPVDGGVVMTSEETGARAELEPAHLAAALQMLLELATTEVATWGESVYQAMGFDGLRAERAAAIQHVDPGGGPRHAAVESLYNVLAAGARQATRPAAERVRAVAGNAARLRGHSRLARETMTLARLLKPGRGAEYQRVAGLVAWEEAGGGEAVAWLERAAERPAADPLPGALAAGARGTPFPGDPLRRSRPGLQHVRPPGVSVSLHPGGPF